MKFLYIAKVTPKDYVIDLGSGEMFLLPDINVHLRPKILDLKPGTRIASNSFTMGKRTADDTVNVKDGWVSYCTAYLWIEPAKAEGTWQLAHGALTLKQSFQMISGTLETGNNSTPIATASSTAIGSFSMPAVRFTPGGLAAT